jgi:hypothetical protein
MGSAREETRTLIIFGCERNASFVRFQLHLPGAIVERFDIGRFDAL